MREKYKIQEGKGAEKEGNGGYFVRPRSVAINRQCRVRGDRVCWLGVFALSTMNLACFRRKKEMRTCMGEVHGLIFKENSKLKELRDINLVLRKFVISI